MLGFTRGALAATVVAAALVTACGGDSTAEPFGSGSGDGGATGATVGATTAQGQGGGASTGAGAGGGETGEWEPLIFGDWELSGGDEGYVCVMATITEEMYVHRFRPVAPLGTHHTVLTRSEIGIDGTFPCNAGTNGQNMIYGSGVGTNPLELPPGVAVRLEVGDRLLLNLHLFNSSLESLSGSSGVEVQRLDPGSVEHLAGVVLAGPQSLAIPPQSTKTETGHCTLPHDVNVFAVGPHMHQIGTHMKVTAERDAGETVVHDEPYSFEDQRHFPLGEQIALAAGDRVRVECTYENPSDNTVSWGDSSNAEMCFASLFLYPAGNLAYLCGN